MKRAVLLRVCVVPAALEWLRVRDAPRIARFKERGNFDNRQGSPLCDAPAFEPSAHDRKCKRPRSRDGTGEKIDGEAFG